MNTVIPLKLYFAPMPMPKPIPLLVGYYFIRLMAGFRIGRKAGIGKQIF